MRTERWEINVGMQERKVKEYEQIKVAEAQARNGKHQRPQDPLLHMVEDSIICVTLSILFRGSILFYSILFQLYSVVLVTLFILKAGTKTLKRIQREYTTAYEGFSMLT